MAKYKNLLFILLVGTTVIIIAGYDRREADISDQSSVSKIKPVQTDSGEKELKLRQGHPCAGLHRVINGDLIVVEFDGEEESVRLLGIEAPLRDEIGFKAATNALKNILGDDDLFLVFEESDKKTRNAKDQLLCHVFAENQKGRTHVNIEMVRQGHSKLSDGFDAQRYSGEFKAAAKEAADRDAQPSGVE